MNKRQLILDLIAMAFGIMFGYFLCVVVFPIP